MNVNLEKQIRSIITKRINDSIDKNILKQLNKTVQNGDWKPTKFDQLQLNDRITRIIKETLNSSLLKNEDILLDLIDVYCEVNDKIISLEISIAETKKLYEEKFNFKNHKSIIEFIGDFTINYIKKITSISPEIKLALLLEYIYHLGETYTSSYTLVIDNETRKMKHYGQVCDYIKSTIKDDSIKTVNFNGINLYYNKDFIKNTNYRKILQHVIHQLMHYYFLEFLIGHEHSKQNNLINLVLERMGCKYLLPISEVNNHNCIKSYIEVVEKYNGKLGSFLNMERKSAVRIGEDIYEEYEVKHHMNILKSPKDMRNMVYIKKTGDSVMVIKDVEEIKKMKYFVKITNDLASEALAEN